MCLFLFPISVCIHIMHPPCIRMHPYASIHLIYPSDRQYSTHVFADKSNSKNKHTIAKVVMRPGAQNRSESKPIIKLGVQLGANYFDCS